MPIRALLTTSPLYGLASDGGDSRRLARLRLALRPHSPRTLGTHADSPRLRLRLALRPHDVLRLALPLLLSSPRTVGPQPHDVLRLALPLLLGSPRTVGPQPHDVLRLALPLRRQHPRVGRRPTRPYAAAGGEAHAAELDRLQLETAVGGEQIAHGLALIHHVRDGGRNLIVELADVFESNAFRADRDGDGGARDRCGAGGGDRHARALDGCAAAAVSGQEVRVADEAGHEDRARGLIDLARGADLLDATGAHDGHAVGHR